MARYWTKERVALLMAQTTDEGLRAAFPNHRIQSLLRKQRHFRSKARDPSNSMEREPRVLVYDLETAPLVGYTWGTWKQNVLKVLQPSYILCFSYRWVGDDKVQNVSLIDFLARFKADHRDDYDVVLALWKLFDEADVIVAHNNNGFDEGKSTARFVKHGLEPPAPWKKVDTLRAARRFFRFDGNSLAMLADFFGIKRKQDPGGFSTWEGCMNPELDKAAWNRMIKYCDHDVQILHEIYWILLPYTANHPNVATLARIEDGCPKCGHKRLKRHGWYSATTYSYPLYRCLRCKGWCKERKSDRDVPKPSYTNIAQ